MQTIRQVGPYTVTTDGSAIYVNGKQASLVPPPAGSALKWVVNTGIKGANGKLDMVGLTADQYAVHTAAVAAYAASLPARAYSKIDAVDDHAAAVRKLLHSSRMEG
jgi:hypothetical protein